MYNLYCKTNYEKKNINYKTYNDIIINSLIKSKLTCLTYLNHVFSSSVGYCYPSMNTYQVILYI